MESLQNIHQFIQNQLGEWPMAESNYAALAEVRTKDLAFEGFEIKVQFNPKRIVSSAAKVDTKSIEARPCFLCAENRPQEQRGSPFNHKYEVLINPFPIFPKHLTIPLGEHTDQLIAGRFVDMLDLAQALPDFVVFYNGPKCGASAPDHFHFQAGSKGFMPIEKDFHTPGLANLIRNKFGLQVFGWKGYLRGIVSFQSGNKQLIEQNFNQIYQNLSRLQPQEKEPMLNILAYVEEGKFIVHVFPRVLHRPKQYFESGSEQILLSPASVDMGGVFITPREEDFDKISQVDVADILGQVSLTESKIPDLIKY
jgi:ATP adenylyltransferase/5',5'''-P-1,P-4-tetraphosphate phosphorylase II